MLLQLPQFDIVSARTLEEAGSLLAAYGPDARVLAGGTDLLVKMKYKKLLPPYLVNIKGVPGLNSIRYESGTALSIGALATVQSIKDSPLVGKRFPALAEAAGKLGTAQIRNLATLGGNLSNASPSAEFGPVLLTLEASVRCVAPGAERTIALREFFLAPGKSALRHGEIVTEVEVPNSPDRAQAVYLKHSLRPMDVAMAAAAVLVVLEGDTCRDVRIALGAVAPVPFRAARAEATMRGKTLDAAAGENELLDEVARVAAGESTPIDDFRGYATYRRQVVAMLVRDGLEQVIARART